MSNVIELINSDHQVVSITDDEKNRAIWANKGFYPRHIMETKPVDPAPAQASSSSSELKLDSPIEVEKMDVDNLQHADPKRFSKPDPYKKKVKIGGKK